MKYKGNIAMRNSEISFTYEHFMNNKTIRQHFKQYNGVTHMRFYFFRKEICYFLKL